ncbi:MAG: hypothetical protein GXY13_10750 [Acidimicrobiales bacterium]|nr:hypothetical protein [Acidimicrobiales bacterium]
MLGADGGLRWRGLLEARNQHPVVLPKAIYWINVLATDGDNRSLGIVVIAIVALTVGLVALLARSTPGIGRARRAALVLGASFLLFAPNGAWNFVKAMSGTAWLTANLLTVAAVLADHHRRRGLAAGLAVLASISYGTGLAAWPALAVAAVVRHGRHAPRRAWPIVVAGVVTLGWYAAWYRSSTFPRGPSGGRLAVVERTLAGIGSLPGDGRAAVPLGIVALGLAAAALAVGLRRGQAAACAPWVAILAYGTAAMALVATSRAESFQARYTSISALTWLGVTGLVLVAVPRPRRWAALVPAPLVVAATLATTYGPPSLDADTRRHDLLAVAMQIGVADGNRVGGGLHPFPVMTDRLRARGH